MYVVDFVEFPSESAAVSGRFFQRAFGWTPTSYGPDYCDVGDAGVNLGFQADRDEQPAGPLVTVRTDDLEAARAAVEVAGGVVTVEAFAFPGGRRFHFREPGGSELAVWQPTGGAGGTEGIEGTAGAAGAEDTEGAAGTASAGSADESTGTAAGAAAWPGHLPVGAVRFARPTARFDAVVAFYEKALGLPVLTRWRGSDGHRGYDGVLVGLPGAAVHLEITQHGDPPVIPEPHPENQLVLYMRGADAVARAAARLAGHGHSRVEAANPYWPERGCVCFADPDGWIVVLAPWVFGTDPVPAPNPSA